MEKEKEKEKQAKLDKAMAKSIENFNRAYNYDEEGKPLAQLAQNEKKTEEEEPVGKSEIEKTMEKIKHLD